MKKVLTFSIISILFAITLCGCKKGEVYPDSLTTDSNHLWVYTDGAGASAELSINESNYCELTVVPKLGAEETTYNFFIMYDSTYGSGSIADTGLGSISGNIIAAQGSEKSTISVNFTQMVGGGSVTVFAGLMTYELLK